MNRGPEWESLIGGTVAELAAGATTVALYGASHPRAEEAVSGLHDRLTRLLKDEPELTLVLLGDDLFCGDVPLAGITRHAENLVHRLQRRGIEHLTFSTGVAAAELREFFTELGGGPDTRVTSRAHIQVGVVDLAEGGGGGGRRSLPTVADRLELVESAFARLASEGRLEVGDLQAVARAIVEALERDQDVFAQCAPWDEEAQWPTVHAHNVATLAAGLARMAGVEAELRREIALAGLVHDIGRAAVPRRIFEIELELPMREVELDLDHPQAGLAILLDDPRVPYLALIAVLEHHLAHDGARGTPKQLVGPVPHPVSRLIAVADAADVIVHGRGGRGLATREATVAWFAESAGRTHDPGWCRGVRQLLEPEETGYSPG
ncbi:MAG: cyclic diguanylate phosphodiesterase [Acidobacteria bacterium]|nr:cyclic diguanylate phosphodiesterase [Acidobacteriota bacterium]